MSALSIFSSLNCIDSTWCNEVKEITEQIFRTLGYGKDELFRRTPYPFTP